MKKEGSVGINLFVMNKLLTDTALFGIHFLCVVIFDIPFFFLIKIGGNKPYLTNLGTIIFKSYYYFLV